MEMSLSELWELVMDREAWHAMIHGVAKNWMRLSDWTELNWTERWPYIWDSKRNTDIKNRLLDSVGEGKGGWFERIALKHIYYHMWNRSPVQVRCMKQDPQSQCTGTLRGMGWGGRWQGVSGWKTHIYLLLIHVNVWQKPPQYCNVIIPQLKLIS